MELKSSPRNWSVESFACPSKEIALVVTWTRDWNAVNAGSIQIETKGTSPSSCSGTQIRYRVGRVAESRKVSVSVRIVLCSSETHLSSSPRQRSLKAENEFMSWGSPRNGRVSHSLGLYVFRRASRSSGVRRAMLANHGVPGRCRYLEVQVLWMYFPYILVS
jgi:hypothetical protein